MLERLSLRNFQCHERITIEFDPFVTVIVGDTDSGKSAILRALRWLCLNQPNGIGFIRRSALQRSGKETLDRFARANLRIDGTSIVRIRGKTDNRYRLTGADYRSFGQGNVPSEIAALLNVGELNFQRQHDASFWFSLTPGQVSRELNSVVNLGLIDEVTSAVTGELRKAKAEVEVTEKRLEVAREEARNLKYVDKLSQDFYRLEAIESSLSEKRSKRDATAKSLESLTESRKRRELASCVVLDAVIPLQRGKRLRELTEQRVSLQNHLNVLSDARERWRNATTRRDESEKRLRSLPRCPMCGKVLSSPLR